MAARKALVVNATKKHSGTVIMAHGLGDSGMGWVDLAYNWVSRNKFSEVKFVFPNAPSIPITINGGFVMPGWYDIVRPRDDSTFSELDNVHDEEGILRSRSVFSKLITDEIDAGIPSDRIVLGGFSQGAAISLFTGVTTPLRLAGVFSLSGYLLLTHKIKDFIKESQDANKETPFFLGHGEQDEVVRYRWGTMTAEYLERELGHKVDFKTYKNLAHSVDPKEIDDLEEFIKKCLPPQETPGPADL